MGTNYKVTNQDIVSESFDGDIVIVDLATGRYFSPSRSGGVLWQLLSAGCSVEAVAHISACERISILRFADSLCDLKLLELADGVGAPEPDPDLIVALQLAQDAPSLAIFDDLAELFMADPIHDVEEPAGWPVVKNS